MHFNFKQRPSLFCIELGEENGSNHQSFKSHISLQTTHFMDKVNLFTAQFPVKYFGGGK